MTGNESLLTGLLAALDGNSENTKLRVSIVQLALDTDRTDILPEVLAPLDPTTLAQDDRKLAAAGYLAANNPARALDFLTEPQPDEQVERARALLALNRTEEAQEEYKKAVAANPALEDKSLASQLSAVAIKNPDPDRPRLKVISDAGPSSAEITRLIAPAEEKVTFEDVQGLDSVKTEIRRKIILPYAKPSLFQRFRKKVGGGILLYGPPGCGKTLLARATAGECNAQFFNVMISDILDMYIGESERKLHALFETVRQNVPAVIFFDEIEGVGAKRQYNRDETSAKVVSQFLSEMDGFNQDNEGVLILSATNVPWSIDPAFRRPGRFDRSFFVPPPDREARAAIFKMELIGRPVASGIDIDFLAQHTSGYSGADLKNVVETAADIAIEASIDRGQEIPIAMEFLTDALKQSTQTTIEWLTTAKNYARYANDGGQYNAVLDFLRKHGK